MAPKDSHNSDSHSAGGTAALVVVGMQRVRLSAPDADLTVRRVCGQVEQARRDGRQVVFIQHCAPAGGPCEKGADGWRLIEALRPQFPDWIVEKSRFSIFDGTNLAAQLKAVGIDRLIFTGPAEDDIAVSCVEAGALGFATATDDDLSEACVMAGQAAAAETAGCV